MNFEDRIRNHMSEQGELIDITPEGPDAAIARQSRRARNRMGTGVVAVMLAAIGGVGLWSLATNDDPVATQVTSVGRDAVERSTDDESSPTVSDTTGDAGGESQTIEVGAPLEVLSINDDGAPGYGSEMRSSGGVYYVLSTAPGAVDLDDPEAGYGAAPFRPNTIYRFDEGAGWSNTEITDRWVSDFVPDDGVLYVLSTGRTDGTAETAVGISSDQGASWDWQPVDGLTDATAVDEDGLSNTTLRLLPVGERQFVLAQQIGYPDWEEAAQLATGAGLEVGARGILNVSPSGITYNAAYQDDPRSTCWDIESGYYNLEQELYEEFAPNPSDELDWRQIEQQIQDALAERSAPFEADLIANGCDNTIACGRVQNAYYSIGQHLYPTEEPDETFDWIAIEAQIDELRELQTPEFEARLVEAGCDNFIACERISAEAAAPFEAEQQAIYARYANNEEYEALTEEERYELSIREQLLWQQIEDAARPALEAAGCPNYYDEAVEEFGLPGDDMSPEDMVFVSWDELGVTPPASWSSVGSYYELVGGNVSELAFPFGDELVVDVRSDTAGLNVVSLSQESYYGAVPHPIEQGPTGTIWTTTDGVTWVAGDRTPNPYGGSYGGQGPVQIGDVKLRIQWPSEGDFATDAAFEIPAIPEDADILLDEESGLPYFVDSEGQTVTIPAPRVPGQAQLERSIGGGPWESISYADLGVDLDELHSANRVIASPIGVFVIANNYGYGPGTSGSSAILYSSDGVNWSSHMLDTADVNPIVGPDSVLFVGTQWYYGEGDETAATPTTLLIRPAN